MNKLLAILFLFLCIPTVFATDIHMFYGQGCPHCAKAIDELTPLFEQNESVHLILHEMYFNKTNQILFQDTLHSLGKTSSGVPTFVIENQVIVGYGDKTKEQIKQAIENPIIRAEMQTKKTDSNTHHISLTAVILGALVDAINPCAFAVLIILLTSLMNKNKKIAIIKSGLAFTLSIFLSYFFMGLGLYQALTFIKTQTFFLIVAIFSIVLGLLNLKDVFWYGKWFVMEVPLSWRPKLKHIIQKVSSPVGSFFVGFLVSLFLLPCTSGPYIAVLGLLAHEASLKAISYLVLYNIIFVVPMIIITCAVAKGIDIAKLEEKRQKHLKTLHLIEAVVLLTLGILLLVYII